MVSAADDGVMTAVIILIAIAALFALAAVYGVDSASDGRDRHRPNWR